MLSSQNFTINRIDFILLLFFQDNEGMLPCPVCNVWYKNVERHLLFHDDSAAGIDEAKLLRRDLAMLSMEKKVLLTSKKVR